VTVNLTDERLCWLAVRQELRERTRGGGIWTWLRVSGGDLRSARGLGSDMARQRRADRMADHAVAVDQAAQKLNAEERRLLRASGRVPDWFLPEVERLAEAERRARR